MLWVKSLKVEMTLAAASGDIESFNSEDNRYTSVNLDAALTARSHHDKTEEVYNKRDVTKTQRLLIAADILNNGVDGFQSLVEAFEVNELSLNEFSSLVMSVRADKTRTHLMEQLIDYACENDHVEIIQGLLTKKQLTKRLADKAMANRSVKVMKYLITMKCPGHKLLEVFVSSIRQ